MFTQVTLTVLNKPRQLNGLITGEMSGTKFSETNTTSKNELKHKTDFSLGVTVRTTADRARRPG